MKKLLSILTAAFLIFALLPMSAAAHGHGHNSGGSGGNGSGVHHSYTQCTVQNCSTETAHRHGRTWYGGHTADDGHSHHSVCSVSVSGCTETGVHGHNGVQCFPKNNTEESTITHTRYRSIGRHH